MPVYQWDFVGTVCYHGNIRAGKTCFMVHDLIIPALAKKRLVVTNIPLVIGKISKKLGFDPYEYIVYLDDTRDGPLPFATIDDYPETPKTESLGSPKRLGAWWHPEKQGLGPLLVIDEAGQVLPSKTSPQRGGKHLENVTDYFRYAGHSGIGIGVISQDIMDIDTSIRRRLQQNFRFSNGRNIGVSGGCTEQMYREGSDDKIGSASPRKYPQWVFRCYKSETGGGRYVPQKRKTVFADWRFLLIGVCLFSVIFYLYKSGSPSFVQPQKATAAIPAPASSPRRVMEDKIHDLKYRREVAQLEKDIRELEAGGQPSPSSGPERLLSGPVAMANDWHRSQSAVQPAAVQVAAVSVAPSDPLVAAGYRLSHVGAGIRVGADWSHLLVAYDRRGVSRALRVPDIEALGYRVEPRAECSVVIRWQSEIRYRLGCL